MVRGGRRDLRARPRIPTLVDVLKQLAQHVVVSLDGEVLADTVRPRLLFETGLPTRVLHPQGRRPYGTVVRRPTCLTWCPYKGVATYWSASVGGETVADIAWSYPFPIPECPKIEGLVKLLQRAHRHHRRRRAATATADRVVPPP